MGVVLAAQDSVTTAADSGLSHPAALVIVAVVTVLGGLATTVITVKSQLKTRREVRNEVNDVAFEVTATRQENAVQHGEVAEVLNRVVHDLKAEMVSVKAGVSSLGRTVDGLREDNRDIKTSVRDIGRSVGSLRDDFIDHINLHLTERLSSPGLAGSADEN